MTKIKISTLTKTAIAVATSLIIISGASFGVYSFILKPYTPIITKISASDPNGTPRSASEFKAGDFIAIQGDNFLQSPYLWLDEIDLHFLNQNKQTITSKRWDNAIVAPKISNSELTKNSIAKIAIPQEVPAALTNGGKLYLKLVFHFHKTWVGTKYELIAQSGTALTFGTALPADLGRQITIPGSWGKGDVFDDPAKKGEVNYDDLLTLGSILKKTVQPTASQKTQADLNLNGAIDFSDYIILNYLIDSDAAFSLSDLPIILGNINRSEQKPTKPNTQVTINNDDLNNLDAVLIKQPTLDYPTFLSADLNSDNDLTKTEDQTLLSQFLNKEIEYSSLPKLIGQNYPPIASAGADADVTIPDEPSKDIAIALDGRGSIDREGDKLTYKWQILSAFYPDGSAADVLTNSANLTDSSKEQAVYTFSVANQKGLVKDTYAIVTNQLTATDSKAQLATDAMQIAVATPKTVPGGQNNSPVAVISANPLTVAPGGKVSLDGLNSYDTDGRITSFKWEVAPQGKGAFLDSRASITSYTGPAEEASVVIKLLITDDKGAVGEASVGVRVGKETAGNNPPVANAGTDKTVVPGQTITLDGSGSYDPDNDKLTYKWEIVSGKGSLTDQDKPKAQYTAPGEEGTAIIKLTVADGKAEAWDEVGVEVKGEKVADLTLKHNDKDIKLLTFTVTVPKAISEKYNALTLAGFDLKTDFQNEYPDNYGSISYDYAFPWYPIAFYADISPENHGGDYITQTWSYTLDPQGRVRDWDPSRLEFKVLPQFLQGGVKFDKNIEQHTYKLIIADNEQIKKFCNSSPPSQYYETCRLVNTQGWAQLVRAGFFNNVTVIELLKKNIHFQAYSGPGIKDPFGRYDNPVFLTDAEFSLDIIATSNKRIIEIPGLYGDRVTPEDVGLKVAIWNEARNYYNDDRVYITGAEPYVFYEEYYPGAVRHPSYILNKAYKELIRLRFMPREDMVLKRINLQDIYGGQGYGYDGYIFYAQDPQSGLFEKRVKARAAVTSDMNVSMEAGKTYDFVFGDNNSLANQCTIHNVDKAYDKEQQVCIFNFNHTIEIEKNSVPITINSPIAGNEIIEFIDPIETSGSDPDVDHPDYRDRLQPMYADIIRQALELYKKDKGAYPEGWYRVEPCDVYGCSEDESSSCKELTWHQLAEQLEPYLKQVRSDLPLDLRSRLYTRILGPGEDNAYSIKEYIKNGVIMPSYLPIGTFKETVRQIQLKSGMISIQPYGGCKMPPSGLNAFENANSPFCKYGTHTITAPCGYYVAPVSSDSLKPTISISQTTTEVERKNIVGPLYFMSDSDISGQDRQGAYKNWNWMYHQAEYHLGWFKSIDLNEDYIEDYTTRWDSYGQLSCTQNTCSITGCPKGGGIKVDSPAYVIYDAKRCE